MENQYFHRVHKLSPTRFWINNPTPHEARLAIAAGAINCTTNPTFSAKMLKDAGMNENVIKIIKEVIIETSDNHRAAGLVQNKLINHILKIFLPLYEKNPGKEGMVSVQGNPFTDNDAQHIIDDALECRKLGKNFLAKIPATKAGIAAMEALIPENIPLIATEIMAISQAVTVCEMYRKVSDQCGKYPPFFVTHITGILDDHLKNIVKRDNIDIQSDILWQAGSIVARKQYRIFKERDYPGVMLGGGARGLHHFTEMVGSEMHITINWNGTSDKLIEIDPPVVYRMDTPAPQYVVDELLDKIPDFEKAYNENGLSIQDFEDYGPVVLFRDMFIKGWEELVSSIEKYR